MVLQNALSQLNAGSRTHLFGSETGKQEVERIL